MHHSHKLRSLLHHRQVPRVRLQWLRQLLKGVRLGIVLGCPMMATAEPQLLGWWSFNNILLHQGYAQHLSVGAGARFGYYDAKKQRLYPNASASGAAAQADEAGLFIDTSNLVGNNFTSGRGNNWGAYKGAPIGRPAESVGAMFVALEGALAISGSANNARFFQIIADLRGYRTLRLCWVERRTARGFAALEASVSTDGKRFTALDVTSEAGAPKKWHRRSALIGDRFVEAPRVLIRFTLHGATHRKGNVRVDNILLYVGAALGKGAACARVNTCCPAAANSVPLLSSPTAAAAVTAGAAAPRRVAIAAIQGPAAQSPYRDQRVRTSGVVTAVFQRDGQLGGFFIQQQPPADNDPRTSEGIFVIAKTPQLKVGDRVTLSARVIEQPTPRQQGVSGALASRTALVADTIKRHGKAPPILPTPLRLPQEASRLEQFEGMLVDLSAGDLVYTVIDTNGLWRYGQLLLAAPDRSGRSGRLYQPTQWHLPDSPLRAQLQARNQRRKIVIDDGRERVLRGRDGLPWYLRDAEPRAGTSVRVGDTLAQNIVGILDFGPIGQGAKRFYGYRLQAVAVPRLRQTNPRPAVPRRHQAGTLRVASYNAQNYFTSLGQRGAANARQRQRQRRKTSVVLQALNADLIALQEIENNRQAIAELTRDLNRSLGSRVYQAVDFGIVGSDSIRSALLYRRQILQPYGTAAVLDDSVDQRAQSRRNRPSIARSFIHRESGERLTVVVTHFKSKGSSCARPLPGAYPLRDPKRDDGQGHCNATRTSAAQALVAWLRADPTQSDGPDILIVGDLNAYAMEDPLRVLERAGFVNAIRRAIGRMAYGYQFRGESGYLSHALTSASLAPRLRRVRQYHINADEPQRFAYYRSTANGDQATRFRASDHDPLIVAIDITKR